MSKVEDAQSYFPSGTTVAEMGLDFSNEFRGTYSDERLSNILAVGPMQAYVGLAIRNGHLAPAAEVAELREQLATARDALARIENWHGEFPSTGQYWENTDGTMSDRPMSYGACYGSNGERDYMRSVARAALA